MIMTVGDNEVRSELEPHVHHAIVGVPCVNVVIGVVLGELHVVRVVPVFVCDAVVDISHFVLIAFHRSHCFHRNYFT